MNASKFRNALELPDWVVRGLTYSNYNPGNVKFDISTTSLIDGPLLREEEERQKLSGCYHRETVFD
jgi:hypothetical protein